VAVYDDQKTESEAEQLRRITGIGADEEQAMDREAHNGATEDIADQEGLYKPGSTDNSGDSSRALKQQEASAGSPANNSDESTSGGGKKLNGRMGKLLRNKLVKRSSIGIALAGLAGGGAIGFFSIASGPLQLIHLSEILGKNMHFSHSASENRGNKLMRYWRAGKTSDIGETRVGKLGSLTFSKTMAQLKDIGIEFERTGLAGNVKSMTVDTTKNPEFKNMSQSEAKIAISKKFGIPESDITRSGGKYSVNTENFGIKAVRGLTKNSLSYLEDGKIISSMKFRILGKFFNVPSLFHPIDRAKASVENNYATKVARKATEAKRAAELEKPTLDKAAPAKASIKDSLSGVKKGVGAALLLTASMCIVRSVADKVVEVNRFAVVEPAALKAVDKMAVGSQIEHDTGNVQTLVEPQVAAQAESLIDANGKSIWAAKSLNATADGSLSGEDISPAYKQAFVNDTTAQNMKDTLGGGGTVGAIVCSPVGLLIQGAGGVVLLISGLFDGGASWAVKAGTAAASTIATAGAIYFIEQQATNILADKAITPAVLAGPVGGNLLAYGAREAANIDARASGGFDLTPAQEAALNQQQEADSQQSFRAKPFFAQMFDVTDYRSGAGKFVDAMGSSFSQNANNLLGSFLNIGSLLSGSFLSLMPTAHAAATYDFGFPKAGIPLSILDDPATADPYDNASKVSTLLSSPDGQQYIDKASVCFGAELVQTGNIWDVTSKTAVNPNSDTYVNAKCSAMDSNWQRVILFILDTKVMSAIACYSTDDVQACQTTAGTSASQPAPTTPNPSGPIDQSTLYQDSSGVQCASGTKDVGVHDGYHNGIRVPIRICAIPSITSTGEESNNGFGVIGAGGFAVVNSRVSANFLAMGVTAAKSGTTLTAKSSFRTMAHQQYLCNKDSLCRNGIYTLVGEPGTSNHQMGIAIDFIGPSSSDSSAQSCSTRVRDTSNATWQWLNKNAAQFGIRQYSAESWHWDAMVASNRCGGDGT
jgi:hypothetical protein